MWIHLVDSFLSIVQPAKADDPKGEMLLVRARAAGDIRRVFPGVTERHVPGRDYAFRALIHRDVVARAIADRITQIGYPNFKNAVPENDRHDAYASCWSAMFGFQRRRHPAQAVIGQREMGIWPPYAEEVQPKRRVRKGKS